MRPPRSCPPFHLTAILSPSLTFVLLWLLSSPLSAHDPVTTKLTWTREISRLLAHRCLACHQTGGAAPFPLASYAEARPWAVAIRDEVAARRMPPWSPVSGFGRFSADPSLSQEEIQLILDWVNGGAPEGDPRFLDPSLPRLAAPVPPPPGAAIALMDLASLPKGELTGLRLPPLPPATHVRVLLESPGGRLVPLAWLHSNSPQAPATYSFAEPVIPAPGSVLRVWASPEPPSPLRLELFVAASPNRPAKPE